MSARDTENVGISLDNDIACREELQRVANGVASLTVDHTKALEEMDELDSKWRLVRAAIYNALNPEKGATADQVHSLALTAIAADKETLALWKAVRTKQTEIDKLERRLKSLDKRLMAASSALKSHESEARSAGFQGRVNM